MTSVALMLSCVAALLATTVLAAFIARSSLATPAIYGLSLGISAIAFSTSLVQLVWPPAEVSTLVLPFGLPWLGAHFRLDPLAAFFLVVVNLVPSPASTASVTDATSMRPTGSCPSSRPSSPA